MPKTKLTNYRPAKIQDLKLNLKYVFVSNNLLESEKKGYFYIYTIRGQLLQGETKQEYIRYKELIKQWTKNKEIWVKD